ncbi:unnamed protein product [Psylliodes chrysocephalus]|uniref:Peptidoglycan recognition protein family domain-containing protein n=1 Tax=Psylliodes chrysocephalus TaxID=3402493 RepID=A0A9P0CH25_9CUCU|nr:unnamed protein product [Psylliodes chrysocephala]
MDVISPDSSPEGQQVQTSINYSRAYSVRDEETPLINRYLYYENRYYDRLAMAFLAILLITGVVIGTYLLLFEENADNNYELIQKFEWTGVQPKIEVQKLRLPVTNISLIEVNSKKCAKQDLSITECLQYLQQKHISKWKKPDILYNFIIDGNGTLYEGRGWKNSTNNEKVDRKRLTIATLLGSIKTDTQAVKTALHNFLGDAVMKKKLVPCFNIFSKNGTITQDVVSFIERQRHFC